jgi:magnesium transporter
MKVLDKLDAAQLEQLQKDDEFFWLDLVDPSDDDIGMLAKRFGWHEMAVEDIRHFSQRPKIDTYGDYMLLVFYGAQEAEPGESPLIEVHLIVSGSYIISVRHCGCSELDQLRARFEKRPGGSEQFIVYSVLDTLTDTFFPVLAAIDEEIDQLEDDIVQQPTDEQLQRVFRLKRRLVELRRIVTPQRDLAARTIDEITDLPGLDPGDRDYFRDVYDHLIRVSDLIDSYRDLVSGAMDVYLSTVSNRLNVVMKQLTVVATIFLPITALTGFFGQNFAWLVNHIHSFAAFLILGIGGIALSIVLLYTWFKRSGFLDRDGP